MFDDEKAGLNALLEIGISLKQHDIIGAALDLGADLGVGEDTFGMPLISAIEEANNDTSIVQLLLERGSDVNARVMGTRTPLLERSNWGICTWPHFSLRPVPM
ncbi:MAG: hypothetical protein R3C10_02600 [Pirellulales bacterium]